MALEKEVKTYQDKLSELKADEGKFVLISGTEIAGLFTSYEDAIQEGYAKFGLHPFLVKKIEAIETIQFISRLIVPENLGKAS